MKRVDIKMSIIIKAFPYIIQSLNVTIIMLLVSAVLGILLGIILTVGKLSKNKMVRVIATIAVSILRGIPVPAILFLVFFGMPILFQNFGINLNLLPPAVFATVALILNSSAFFAEIFRGAYLAVDKGQIEAGYSIGMNDFQLFLRVIFPQAAIIALPNLSNMIIELLKNTALAFSIGVIDLMGRASQYSSATWGAGQAYVFIITGAIYWALSIIIEKGMEILNNKISHGNSKISLMDRTNQVSKTKSTLKKNKMIA